MVMGALAAEVAVLDVPDAGTGLVPVRAEATILSIASRSGGRARAGARARTRADARPFGRKGIRRGHVRPSFARRSQGPRGAIERVLEDRGHDVRRWPDGR